MKILNKKIWAITVVAALVMVASAMLLPNTVLATAKQDACAGVGVVSGSGCVPTTGPTVQSLITTIVNVLSLIIGVVAVIMVIIGGFRYVTSNGDSNNTNAARNTIIYALVGLVVAALAQVIVHFVLSRL